LSTIRELAERARRAARLLAPRERGIKDQALLAIARDLRQKEGSISEANALDIERARSSGLSAAQIDRLGMGPKVLEATARGVEHVVSLPDPVGSRGRMDRLKNGLLVGKERIPLGVVALVYESRPNVTVDAAALCLKSGNAVLLRGGKEAAETNLVLGRVLRQALAETGLPPDAIQIVPPTDRDGIRELVSLTGLVDLAIPRGGEGLIRFVAEHARVPVIAHYKGVCHLFLDEGCDHDMAIRLTLNSKVQRPGVCNALECLLVHEDEAEGLLPRVAEALTVAGVEIRGCPRTLELVSGAAIATDADWGHEYLGLVLAVRVVRDLDQALDHVARYGSSHTEAICTRRHDHAQRWLREVDASCVLINASTRFNDGGELGLGAEIGISTTKLHAYGPMGLETLTAEKWVVLGDGQIRQ
jgi:glutamate-5-semialdehyde dehydrogenase